MVEFEVWVEISVLGPTKTKKFTFGMMSENFDGPNQNFLPANFVQNWKQTFAFNVTRLKRPEGSNIENPSLKTDLFL